jgi:hypothetical protein
MVQTGFLSFYSFLIAFKRAVSSFRDPPQTDHQKCSAVKAFPKTRHLRGALFKKSPELHVTNPHRAQEQKGSGELGNSRNLIPIPHFLPNIFQQIPLHQPNYQKVGTPPFSILYLANFICLRNQFWDDASGNLLQRRSFGARDDTSDEIVIGWPEYQPLGEKVRRIWKFVSPAVDGF